jgi:hypothetical protein
MATTLITSFEYTFINKTMYNQFSNRGLGEPLIEDIKFMNTSIIVRGRHDHMVVGFITTYAISALAYHH